MEKRYIIGAVLCFGALILWQVYFGPSVSPPRPQPLPAESAAAPSAAEAQDRSTVAEPPVTEPAEESPVSGVVSEAIQAERVEEITVETDLLRVVLTNRGARVVSWTLKDYNARDGAPLQVVSSLAADDDRLPLGLLLGDPGLSKEVNRAPYRVERQRLPSEHGMPPGERVSFTWADGRGIEVEKTLEFRDREHLVGVEVMVADRGRRLPVSLTWGPGFQTRSDGNGMGSYYYANLAQWDIAGQVGRETKVKKDLVVGGPLYWGGLADQFFTALILPRDRMGEFRAWPVEVVPGPIPGQRADAEPSESEVRPMVAVTVSEEGALLYVGPKNYNMLKGLGHDLDQAVWFSSYSLFSFMARFLYEVLVWIHTHVVPNYGLAIILTTLMLRIVLFPLNQFSMVRIKKSQAEMQKVQPKINAIKSKYRKKKDAESRAQMNQEVMGLYKKEGINPMGGMMGCLPMVAQFPILIGYYFMLSAAIELRGAPFFGWIQDLTLKDPYYVTPLLMGATMFMQQRMTATKMGDPAQQRIMMMTPVIFTVMFLNLPSGLVLYWFVNNLLGIGQQWLVNRHVGRMESARA